ncbi:hypothetical protein [Hyphomicrobium sp. 802]|uniref:hypothetical protein n=1 Tax=Hyphomicrobium sp. 802 TaxID=1112272 RepID=UPI0012DCD981|nr:hypothetical protein [Hyphomicrobium sp. 802]
MTNRTATFRTSRFPHHRSSIEEKRMARDLILWFAGVPLVVIIGLHLFGFLH